MFQKLVWESLLFLKHTNGLGIGMWRKVSTFLGDTEVGGMANMDKGTNQL